MYNPFAELADFMSPAVMQTYIVLMIIAVAAGTIFGMFGHSAHFGDAVSRFAPPQGPARPARGLRLRRRRRGECSPRSMMNVEHRMPIFLTPYLLLTAPSVSARGRTARPYLSQNAA